MAGPSAEEPAIKRKVITVTEPQGKCTAPRDVSSPLGDEISPDLVREWAQPILLCANEVGPVPLPGTDAWHALSNEDPRKRAAVVYAALWWCDQHSPAALTERAEVADQLDRSAEKQAAVALSLAPAPGAVSHAELVHRRATYIDRPPIDRVALRRWVITGHSEEPQENVA